MALSGYPLPLPFATWVRSSTLNGLSSATRCATTAAIVQKSQTVPLPPGFTAGPDLFPPVKLLEFLVADILAVIRCDDACGPVFFGSIVFLRRSRTEDNYDLDDTCFA